MPDLVERETQREQLTEIFSRAEAGAGSCVLLAGEAGIGKTALIAALASSLGARAELLVGACDALATPRPLGPLADIARPLGESFAKLFFSGAARSEVFDTLQETLSRRKRVVLLVFEDIHWADEATLDLMRFLARRIARLPVLMVLTYRDDEWSRADALGLMLGDLVGPQIVRMRLDPLTERGVEALVEMERTAGKASAAELHELTGGNPFFMVELLKEASERLPASVRDVVLARLNRLDFAVQRFVRIVSLVPHRCETALFEAAFSDELAAARAVSRDAMGKGLVVDEGAYFRFRHELARLAIAEEVGRSSTADARAWHRRFLEMLAVSGQAPLPLSRLAHHAAGSGDAALVKRWALPAAREAQRVGANREAAKLYAQALQVDAGWSELDRLEAEEGFAMACAAASRFSDAISARKRALEHCVVLGIPLREGDNLRWLAGLHWLDGDRENALTSSDHAIECLEPFGATVELAWAYATRAQFHMTAEENAPAIGFAQRALALAESLTAREVKIHALNTLGDAGQYIFPDWRDKIEQSLAMALESKLDEPAARAYINLVSTAVVANEFEVARHYLKGGIAFCEARDLDYPRDYLRAWQARERFESGAWDEAEQLAKALCARQQAVAVARIPALATLAALATRRGAADAEEALQRAEGEARRTGEHQRIAPLLTARAEQAWLHRDMGGAAAFARSGIAAALEHGSPDNFGRFAVWLWRAGEAVDLSQACPARFKDEIEGRANAAAAAWEGIGCPYERALALANCGVAEQRAAVGLLETLGARPAAALLRSRLKLRGAPPGPRSVTRKDPLGLTRREREVFDLVALGLNNAAIAKRLFRSERTIEHHVSAVLAKLGVATRAEATALVGSRRSSDRSPRSP